MKKLLICLFALAGGLLTLRAETKNIGITIQKKDGTTIGNTIKRSPMNLPIEVILDDTTGLLTVSAPEDMEGYVYVYNMSGVLEGSSQTLNVTFTLPRSGVYVIALEGETWTGEGKIGY
ncbi:MAG: hypothetical protein K2M56_10705 [Muribaculaceae bacterium]|nr:hypothetical protein [Muribaculaceae bacterium]